MLKSIGMLARRLATLGLLAVPVFASAETTHTFVTFDNGTLNQPGWIFGAQDGGTVSVSTDASKNLNGSAGSLKGTYPTPVGSVYAWGTYSVASLNTYELYIEFWAKMPAAKEGLKFLKVFGGDSSGYANTTFALDYTGADYGSMYQVSFGDGSTAYNDTANVINFDGSYPQWIGRSFGTARVQTPMGRSFRSTDWGTAWHKFRIRVKYNSGTTSANQIADGAYYVEIDGNVYVNATGLYNRHYSNKPIDRVELFGWTQSGTRPFEIWYDDVRISSGGFASSGPEPMPPTDVSAD
jgi:hypothetical protein